MRLSSPQIAVRLSLLAALGAGLLLAVPQTAAAEPPPGAAGWLFEPEAVVRVDLDLPATSIEALEGEPDEYQPGSFSLDDGGQTFGPLDVGIRLKGSAGSFRPLTRKAAFKVKFDEYVDDQTFFGLEKLTLNNMVQDESMIHETLTYEAFRVAGLAAPRTGYAFVSVNGEDFGLYLNVETLDLVSLPRWFGSTRHLYEGGYTVDVRPGGAGAFEVDEGKSKDRADLEALIAAANEESGDWSDGVAAVADLEQMTKVWAIERYVGHWDGYAGRLLGPQPNNYYLHSEASGLFRMLPWGTDQTWEARLSFDEAGGLLLNRCLGDESCAAMYRDAVRRTRGIVAGLDPLGRIWSLAGVLRPWQEIDPRREQSMTRIANAVLRARDFVKRRPGDVAAWLGEEPASGFTDLPEAGPPPPASTDRPADQGGRKQRARRRAAAKRHRKCQKRREAQRKAGHKPVRCPRP
jgi:CotH kinase protein